MTKIYKVIQWATGSMGKTCLRAIIDHPQLELVGVYVYNPKKVGVDAGDIAHRDATGVLATNDIEEILKLAADVVFHTPQIRPPYTSHNEDICRLLSSGKNLISINGHSYPQYWGSDYCGKFEDACRTGNSTLMGGGLNPGFIADKIAAVACSVCLELKHIAITEVVECNVMQNYDYVFNSLGFGSAIDSIDPNDPNWPAAALLNGIYSEVVAGLVQRTGKTLQAVTTDHRVFPASKDISMAAGLIKKDTISHTNWRWHGMVDDQPLVTMSIHWIMEKSHLAEQNPNFWSVKVSGLPEVEVSIDLKVPAGHAYRTTAEQYGVAGSLINAIPQLVSSPTGLHQLQLPDSTFHQP